MNQTDNEKMLLFTHDMIVRARVIGYKQDGLAARIFSLFSRKNKEKARQISDLLDIIHNIPKLVAENKGIDKDYVQLIFKEYESKWGHVDKETIKIMEKYDM